MTESMNPAFGVRADQDALVVSFPAPVRVLSWAVLNGGLCQADYVIKHHVRGDDPRFCDQPGRWLEEAASRLRRPGTVVAMATAVQTKNLVQVSLSGGWKEVTCFATAGCGHVLSVGDPAFVAAEEPAPSPLHTINMIVAVQPGLTDEAMVEAIQIATKGRVRGLYEAQITSSVSNLAATVTSTDCIAVVSLGRQRERDCGKHTRLGEMIRRAAYIAVRNGLPNSSPTNGVKPGGNSND